MTSGQNAESERAYQTLSDTSQQYYGVAIPAMERRQQSAQAALAQGESPLMAGAFQAQRAGLTEGLTGQEAAADSQKMRASKSALSGGNAFSMLHPAEIGSKLANALWGSKYTEGQADIENRLGLMSAIMGGSAMAGNAGLQVAGNQLGAIQHLPNYNETYANIVGGASLGASVYGGLTRPGLSSSPPGVQPFYPSWVNPATGQSGIA